MHAQNSGLSRKALKNVLTFLGGSLILLALGANFKAAGIVTSDKASAAGAAIVMLGICVISVAALVRFLAGPTFRIKDHELEHLKEEVERLDRRMYHSLHHQSTISEEQVAKMTDELTSRVRNASTESMLAELREASNRALASDFINNHTGETLARIYSEIERLSRRGNLNLAIGVLMALVGVGLLAYMVIWSTSSYPDFTSFAMALLPRLSVVAIIEIFSYFFLRLYKSTLADIKYYQNEATTVESWTLALHASVRFDSAEDVNKVVNKLLDVDRNSPLTAGVSTRELEDARLFKDANIVSLPALTELLKSLRK